MNSYNVTKVARRRQYLAAMGVQSWRLRTVAGGAGQDPGQHCEPGAESPIAAPVAPLPLPADTHAGVPDFIETVPIEATAASPGEVLEREPATSEWPDWTSLQAAVTSCTRCHLHTGRNRTVFGVGDRDSDWMIIGEAPGADEDRLGEPFVGRAGELLDQMLAAVGRGREQVFIANILKCRPPRNRDPSRAEADCCRAFLDRQIELLAPRVILVVGRIAAHNLLATDQPMRELRGRVHRYRSIPLVVSYHPAYLLRSPGEKRKAWEDLKRVCRVLEGAE